MSAIDFSQLQQDIVRFQPDLRTLPYIALDEFVNRLNIRLLEGIIGKDEEQELQIKGGLLRPYVDGAVSYDTSLGRIRKFVLEPKPIYYALRDNRMNYRTKHIVNLQPTDNQTKQHPLAGTMVDGIIRSFADDLMYAFWCAVYDPNDQSPGGAFDGIYKKITDYIASGDISQANGNLVPTGPIQPPTSNTDTSAIDKLVDFVKKAHYLLRGNGVLYMPFSVYTAAIQAYENKVANRPDDISAIENYINVRTNGNIRIVVSEHMGNGDLIILATRRHRIFDLGVNTRGDFDFVQLIQDNDDPNVWKFWIQAEADTRIRGLNRKIFQINDGNYNCVFDTGDYH